MNESIYPELAYEDALAAVLDRVAPISPMGVPLAQAAGLVLAADVLAREPMPPFAAAAKDGYAVVASDGPGTYRLVGESAAGRLPDCQVLSGTVARIATGAVLPDGADAVLMVEFSSEADGLVTLLQGVTAGADVRPAGADYRAGTVVVSAGSTFGPADLGLAASAGAATVLVHPRPRVAVVSTGDELVAPETVPAPGQIRDSNRLALMAAVALAGGEPIDGGHLRDDTAATFGLAALAEQADAVVTSGGVSMGRRDLVKPWLAAHGEVIFGRVNVKPGKPATFGRVGGTPVFALPGFPVSALVAFETLVRPALLRLAGRRDLFRPVWDVSVKEALHHPADRTEFQRAHVSLTAAGPVARATGDLGSGRLLSWTGANALLRLEAGTSPTPAGARVPAWILGPVEAA